MRERTGVKLFAAICTLALAGIMQSPLAMAGEKTPRDKEEALRWMEESVAKNGMGEFRVENDHITFTDGRNHFHINLAVVNSIELNLGYRGTAFARGVPSTVSWTQPDYVHSARIGWRDAGEAKKFHAALEFLSTKSRQEEPAREEVSFEQFKGQAAAWRAMSVKPEMPEEARQHKVLAEYAFQQKDAGKAIREYAAALSLFPCWPEGQFNLAVLAGEQKDYATAVLHMKEYLELVPDAQDAQAGRDKIIIWQDQLTEVAAAPLSSPPKRRK